MRKSLCFMRSLLSHLAWLRNSMFRETSPVPYCMASLCYMIHYGTYRGAVVGVRGAVVGVGGAAVGVRGAAVGNIGIPTYVISWGAVVRQPSSPRCKGTFTLNHWYSKAPYIYPETQSEALNLSRDCALTFKYLP